jgi:hypothetical protein
MVDMVSALIVFLSLFSKYSLSTFKLGPNAHGNFFDKGWQDSLSNKSPENEPIRKAVLGRIRLPVTESGKYDQGRDGQAYPYFMPWLSGDGGSYSILMCHLFRC